MSPGYSSFRASREIPPPASTSLGGCDAPWLMATSLQSLPLWSHGLLLISVCLKLSTDGGTARPSHAAPFLPVWQLVSHSLPFRLSPHELTDQHFPPGGKGLGVGGSGQHEALRPSSAGRGGLRASMWEAGRLTHRGRTLWCPAVCVPTGVPHVERGVGRSGPSAHGTFSISSPIHPSFLPSSQLPPIPFGELCTA